MMLTTPAIASEPYSAEAPSCRISMRSMMLIGMVLRSTAAETPEADDSFTQRRPSTRIRVRLAPRSRRLRVDEPEPTPLPSGGKPKLPAELNLVLSAEPDEVSCCSTSPMLVRPACWMSLAVIVITGVWVAMSAPRMREPVTSTASSRVVFLAFGVGVGCAASWACSSAGARQAAMARNRCCRRNGVRMRVPLAWVAKPRASGHLKCKAFVVEELHLHDVSISNPQEALRGRRRHAIRPAS